PAAPAPRTVSLAFEAAAIAGDPGALWVAGAGRLRAFDGRSGAPAPRRAARLAAGQELLSDGRQGWLAGAGALQRLPSRPDRPRLRLAAVGEHPLLARAGGWLWAVAP